MGEKRYCSACGAELGADGICTRESCARRKIQLRKMAADDKVEKAKSK